MEERIDGYDLKTTTREVEELDISKLVAFVEEEAIALVTAIKLGRDRNEMGFVTFSIKDCHGNVITGRLFNAEDYLLTGGQASIFKGKPVKIKFITQEFNSRLSLVVKEIEIWEGDFDKAKFIGNIPVDRSTIVSLGKALYGESWEIPIEYEVASFEQITNWRVGGFLKLFDMSVAALSGYIGVTGVNYNELLRVYFSVIDAYYRYFKALDTYGKLSKTKVFDILFTYQRSLDSSNMSMIILDTVRSLLGLSEPEHLYSRIINSTVQLNLLNLNAAYDLLTCPIGATIWSGGVELLKY